MIEAWMAGRASPARCADPLLFGPCLGRARAGLGDEAFAVNAHGPLRTLAREKGWAILDWER